LLGPVSLSLDSNMSDISSILGVRATPQTDHIPPESRPIIIPVINRSHLVVIHGPVIDSAPKIDIDDVQSVLIRDARRQEMHDDNTTSPEIP